MAWWRGCDRWHMNDKLLAVGLLGTGLHSRAISWCSSAETDGRLPAAVVPSLSPELTPRVRQQLVRAMCMALAAGRDPLWTPEENLAGEVVAYWVHDYLKFNPGHAQLDVKRESERKRLAGKRGAC